MKPASLQNRTLQAHKVEQEDRQLFFTFFTPLFFVTLRKTRDEKYFADKLLFHCNFRAF